MSHKSLCVFDTLVREGKVVLCVYEQENRENIFPNVFLMFGNWLEAFGFLEVINCTMGAVTFIWICAQPIHFGF